MFARPLRHPVREAEIPALARIVKTVAEFRFGTPPLLRVDFDGTRGSPDTFRGDFLLRCGAVASGPYRLDRAECDGSFRAGSVQIRRQVLGVFQSDGEPDQSRLDAAVIPKYLVVLRRIITLVA